MEKVSDCYEIAASEGSYRACIDTMSQNNWY